jgi:hypothetical protein
MQDIRELVKAKVEGFDPNAGEEEMEFTGSSIPWTKLFTPFAGCGDYGLLCGAVLFSTSFGASLPAFCLFVGGAIDEMGSADADMEALVSEATTAWMLAENIDPASLMDGTYTEESLFEAITPYI